jgi:hypothetical protein
MQLLFFILRVDQSDFMRFMEVENHDDFYAYHDDGSVQVWDMRGVAIMYESSLTRLKELEEELLLIASFYMRKVALRDRYVCGYIGVLNKGPKLFKEQSEGHC